MAERDTITNIYHNHYITWLPKEGDRHELLPMDQSMVLATFHSLSDAICVARTRNHILQIIADDENSDERLKPIIDTIVSAMEEKPVAEVPEFIQTVEAVPEE